MQTFKYKNNSYRRQPDGTYQILAVHQSPTEQDLSSTDKPVTTGTWAPASPGITSQLDQAHQAWMDKQEANNE